MGENKRRFGKGTTAIFAFAATLLAAGAVSVTAAAEDAGSDYVQDPELEDVQNTGTAPDYNKLADNVYSATGRSSPHLIR